MSLSIRRLAIAATLAAALAACTSPLAPTAASSTTTPAERPSSGVYQGGTG